MKKYDTVSYKCLMGENQMARFVDEYAKYGI